ncbi:MAG TPA: hypothetical protein PKA19_03110 [Bacillota bacterium]|nr:hypothetical protein [Bacillota bacterium]
MKRRFMPAVFLLILLMLVCGCASQPKDSSDPASKEPELYSVADNISLKTGTEFDGETVLEYADFTGFSYKYDEERQNYTFNFKLTDEGRAKMAEATKNSAEEPCDLSLWIGEELITSPRVMEPITGDEFALNMADVDKDNISDVVDRLRGK